MRWWNAVESIAHRVSVTSREHKVLNERRRIHETCKNDEKKALKHAYFKLKNDLWTQKPNLLAACGVDRLTVDSLVTTFKISAPFYLWCSIAQRLHLKVGFVEFTFFHGDTIAEINELDVYIRVRWRSGVQDVLR